ncbi:TrmH family RNA methyltransferase [Salana multivorans]|uniref:TrmH family RNA methyltransferase n=1 Tax=Salana multivorans TaxID=120377 RepID=A0A3N2D9Y1_9MICO|nr:TrmH family RNA methyltransferase [Salana multivorans]ROR96523.1 TrmH family RNA methyltransferase [Salana multivorans]
MPRTLHVTRPNAQFQQWEALLRNRTKRLRAGELVVQGVRPITLALEHGWRVRAVLYDDERPLSRWAEDLLERARGLRVAMAPDLLRQLSDKDEDVPELIAVVAMPEDDLARIPVGPSFLGAVFDRPTQPGNVGTMVRSLDAFGGSGLVVTGHGADPYDPKTVRASTGSLFAVPVVRAPSHREVLAWVTRLRAAGHPITVVGTDEHGTATIDDVDLTGPTLLVIGNETAGLSSGWREACDVMARIPIGGAASSLNAASAATVTLYEAARQRSRTSTTTP